MAIEIIQYRDLHPQDFRKTQIDGENKIRVSGTLQNHLLVRSGNAVAFTTNEKNFIESRLGMARIHLDFRLTAIANNSAIATLPANAPTFLSLIEIQTHNGGTIWISQNSRTIYSNGLTANTRFIADLIGFVNN